MAMHIFPDSIIYLVGDTVRVGISITRPEKCQDESAELEIRAMVKDDLKSVELFSSRDVIKLTKGSADISYVFDIKPGIAHITREHSILYIEAIASICGYKEKDSTVAYIYPEVRRLVDLVIVWHHHQPPNYLPNGQYFADYPFRWVWFNLFEPYTTGGPYNVHASVYKMFPSVKTTVHLSPSLLAQWRDAIENGYVMESGAKVSKDDRTISMINTTLNMYRELALNGTIEILTSVYAHTIAGYIIDRLGMDGIIREELEIGKEMTKTIMGVEPIGIWTPEMAWHNRLTELYHDIGIRYTVLCGKSHYIRAIGDKGTQYELYRIVYGGKSINILFRDQEISDIIGFNNNFPVLSMAFETARDVARRIVSRRGIVTIALDGENWMIFSKYPSNTYPFLLYLYQLLDSAQKKGFIRCLLGRDAVEMYRDRERKLIYISTTSWINGFSKWNGDIAEQKHMWHEVSRAYDMIRLYRDIYGDGDGVRKAKWALYHAIDSDFWWADFWNPRVIREWINEIYRSLYSYRD